MYQTILAHKIFSGDTYWDIACNIIDAFTPPREERNAIYDLAGIYNRMQTLTPEDKLLQHTFGSMVDILLFNSFNDDVDSLSGHLPEDWFDYIGCGSYKVAYSLSPEWVVKFTEDNNVFEQEVEIYEIAKRNPVMSDLFVDTFYYTPTGMRVKLPADYDKKIWNMNEAIVFQRKIDFTEDKFNEAFELKPASTVEVKNAAFMYSINAGEKYYNERQQKEYDIIYINKDLLDSVIPNDDEVYLNWWIMVRDYLGKDRYEEYKNFVDEYNICDLRASNVGFICVNGSPYTLHPVIIDWLSDESGYYIDRSEYDYDSDVYF